MELILKRNRISVDEASKELGFSKTLVTELANFLEEEKLITIEYNLTKIILIKKEITEQDLTSKKIEFRNIKELLIRKIENFLQVVDKESYGINKFKKEFMKLKKDLDVEVSKVKDELNELMKYEELKKDIDNQIIEQQGAYKRRVEEAHQRLLDDEKRYKQIIDTISKEQEIVTQEENELNEMYVTERKLKAKINEINKTIKEVDTAIKNENDRINQTKDKINDLKKEATQIKDNMEKEVVKVENIINEGKKQEKVIMDLSKNLLKKVMIKKEDITKVADEGEVVLKKFNNFFSKKKEIEKLVTDLDSDKNNMKEEFNKLIKSVKMVDITKNTKNKIEDMKKNLKMVESKKNSFMSNIIKVKDLLKK